MKFWKIFSIIFAAWITAASAQTVVPDGTVYPSGETNVFGPATIETQGSVIVPAGADVLYGASTRIRLTPGFQVMAGGTFQAYITQNGYIDTPANVSFTETSSGYPAYLITTTIYFSINDGGNVVSSSASFTDGQVHPWVIFNPLPPWPSPYSLSFRLGAPLPLAGPGYVFWILKDYKWNADAGSYTQDYSHVFAAFYKRKPLPRWEVIELACYKGGGLHTNDPYTYTFNSSKVVLQKDSIQWEVHKTYFTPNTPAEDIPGSYAVPTQDL